MSRFYEIIEKLKTNPEKRKKKNYSKKFIFFLMFLLLIVGSGAGLILLTSYIEKESSKLKISEEEEKIFSQKESITKSTKEISAPFQNKKEEMLSKNSSEISFKKGVSKKSYVLKKDFVSASLPKNFVKSAKTAKNPQPEKISIAESKEAPLEGFILNKEDLLRNLLIMAEEERKKGNCKEALFYYRNYLKERDNPMVMNNFGACLIELEKLDEAINVFEKALSLKSDPEIKYNLIIAYLKKGEKEKACNTIKEINSDFFKEKIKTLENFCK